MAYLEASWRFQGTAAVVVISICKQWCTLNHLESTESNINFFHWQTLVSPKWSSTRWESFAATLWPTSSKVPRLNVGLKDSRWFSRGDDPSWSKLTGMSVSVSTGLEPPASPKRPLNFVLRMFGKWGKESPESLTNKLQIDQRTKARDAPCNWK